MCNYADFFWPVLSPACVASLVFCFLKLSVSLGVAKESKEKKAYLPPKHQTTSQFQGRRETWSVYILKQTCQHSVKEKHLSESRPEAVYHGACYRDDQTVRNCYEQFHLFEVDALARWVGACDDLDSVLRLWALEGVGTNTGEHSSNSGCLRKT